jgi:hypothetical protein
MASSIAILLALLSAPSISLAHERRTVAGGKYDVVVGWDTEPAYADQKNAASIRISKAGTNPAEPITGADKTLKVDIRNGAQTRTFDLRTVFGQPGYYVADILPTRDGDYIWTFMGSIGDDKISEKFDTADGKFDKVQPVTGLAFPVALPDPSQVNADVQSARAAGQSAQTTALIGVALGVLGILAAAAVWLTRPRHTVAPISSSRPAGERIS